MPRKPRESLRPAGAPRLGESFHNWRDFTERVCRPWMEDCDAKTDAWYRALFLQMTPEYLAAALVMADNALDDLAAVLREHECPEV